MFGQPLPYTICAAIVLGNLGHLQVLLGLGLVELFSWFDFTFRFCLSAACAGAGSHPGGVAPPGPGSMAFLTMALL